MTYCGEWCQSHDEQTWTRDEEEFVLRRHHADLLTEPHACASEGQAPFFRLYVGAVDALTQPEYSHEPEIDLTFGGGPDAIPRSIQPEVARRLAAALIRGAEIVESYRTASCRGCGRAVLPEEAEACILCQLERDRAARNARKDALRVVT